MSTDSSSDTKSLFDVFKKDNIINSTSQITNYYKNMSNNSSLYIGLFLVIAITVIIAILLYTFLGWQLFSKKEQTVDETKVPVVGTKSSKFSAEIAETANGSRRSFSFWIYINDMNKYIGQYKNVLALSSDGNEFNPNTSGPYVFLDKTNNSMYITFSRTKGASTKPCSIMNIDKIKEYMKYGIYIKYIPLQRWVNVVIVCNTDSFKSSLYAYIDGDLVSNITHGQKNINIGISETDKLEESDINNINLNISGYLYVGADNNSKCGPGFSGLISNFKSYNYELNNKDIYNIYNKGPINGLLATLGLSSYGIRSPIYKI
jgi:hypothetical protein